MLYQQHSLEASTNSESYQLRNQAAISDRGDENKILYSSAAGHPNFSQTNMLQPAGSDLGVMTIGGGSTAMIFQQEETSPLSASNNVARRKISQVTMKLQEKLSPQKQS